MGGDFPFDPGGIQEEEKKKKKKEKKEKKGKSKKRTRVFLIEKGVPFPRKPRGQRAGGSDHTPDSTHSQGLPLRVKRVNR